MPQRAGIAAKTRSRRGFAAMDPTQQRAIAAMGGRASHGGRGRNWQPFLAHLRNRLSQEEPAHVDDFARPSELPHLSGWFRPRTNDNDYGEGQVPPGLTSRMQVNRKLPPRRLYDPEYDREQYYEREFTEDEFDDDFMQQPDFEEDEYRAHRGRRGAADADELHHVSRLRPGRLYR
jgi:hypothetical protein